MIIFTNSYQQPIHSDNAVEKPKRKKIHVFGFTILLGIESSNFIHTCQESGMRYGNWVCFEKCIQKGWLDNKYSNLGR